MGLDRQSLPDAVLKRISPEDRKRDGVVISNGLRADFRLLYAHPNARNVYRIKTACGDHYIHGQELLWD